MTFDEEFDRTKEANLVGHLANPDDKEAKRIKEADRIKKITRKLEKDKKAELTEADLSGELTDEDKPLDETDYQLARALDMVRALFIFKDQVN